MPTDSYPLHPDQAHAEPQPLYVAIPQEEYDRLCKVEKEWKETVEAFQKSVGPMIPYYPDKFCPRCGKPLDEKKWHKFSEELPNEDDYYLVTNGDFVDFEFGCYNEQDEEWNWDHNGKWKYWMPMPNPPKEEK